MSSQMCPCHSCQPDQSGLLPKHTHELLAVGSCHATNTQPEEMTSTQDVTIMWTSNRSKQGWPNAKYGMRSLLCHQKARANEPAAQPTQPENTHAKNSENSCPMTTNRKHDNHEHICKKDAGIFSYISCSQEVMTQIPKDVHQ